MRVRKFLIAGILFAATAPQPADAQTADQLIQQYQLQLIRGRNTADAWALLGYAYLQKARETSDPAWYDSAEVTLQRAYGLDSTSARVNKYLAMSQAARHEFRQALQFARRALSAKPNDAHTLGLIGDAYLEVGQPDSARFFYVRMDSVAPPDLASLARRARLWLLAGRSDSARTCFLRASASVASEQNPEPENLAWVAVMLGELDLTAGNFTRADSFYHAALTYLPDYPLALEHAAEIKKIAGRYAEALALYRRAVASSSNPGLLVFLGDALEKAGRPDSAEIAWQKGEAGYVRLIASGNRGYLRPLALFYLDHRRSPEKALTLAQQDLTIRQDYGAYLTLGRAYLQLGQKKEALAAIQKAGPEAENDPQFCCHAGEIYLADGNKSKAKDLFARALRLCPAYDEIYSADLSTKLTALNK
jgi:tetratricopeptide (TPR) repeat protein